MKELKYFLRFITFASIAIILTACGGGGGDSSASGPGEVTAITSDNYDAAAAYAYQSISGLSTLEDITGDISPVPTGISIQPHQSRIVNPTVSVIKLALANRPATQYATGLSDSETLNCSGGGTLRVSVTYADEYAITDGDRIAITASNCTEAGETLNGSFSVSIDNPTGDVFEGDVWSATLAATYNNFSVASGGNSISADGDMSMAINQASSSHSTVTLSGSRLTNRWNTGGANVLTSTLWNYAISNDMNGTTLTQTANYAVSGSGSSISNFSYTVTTPDAFVTNISTELYPHTGRMKVVGLNSAVVMSATSSTDIQVDYYSSTDTSGTPAATRNIHWTDIEAIILDL